MNKFKIWQIFIIYAIVLVGIIYALPNFYPTKPSLQIAFGDSSKLLGKNITTEVNKVLKDQEIKYISKKKTNYSDILKTINSIKNEQFKEELKKIVIEYNN